MPEFEIRKAVRRALPIQMAFYGPTGSGKTFSALLFSAGLAADGKVAIIDTERGRGSLYADNKKILAALPNGYDVMELDPPYHPQRFMKAIDAVEAAGYSVCLIDSLSDAWDGPGGCADLAEAANRNWIQPKLWNKKMMMRIVSSNMNIICLFKAQEKTKVIDKTKSASGKQEYVDRGMQPVSEKGNFYPMLLGFSVDPATHLSTVIKCHDDLIEIFREPKLISKRDGELVLRWNKSGAAMDPMDAVQKRAKAAAEQGMEDYTIFFNSLTAKERKDLAATTHGENKSIASHVDERNELLAKQQEADQSAEV